MISLSRPFFTPVAILLRQSSGGFVVGFLPFAQTMVWFAAITLFLLLLRGYAEDTWVGGLLAVPIARPMAVLTIGLAVVWLVRSVGLWSPHGPIRDHYANPAFTGRASRLWSRIAVTDREWTVLEVYEPLILTSTGIVLTMFPWTRIAGVMLIAMAAACAYQTISDLRYNNRGEESLDDFIAGVLSTGRDEVEEEEEEDYSRPHVPDSPFADLSDDLVALMDDETKAAIEQARSEATPPPARARTSKKAKRRRYIELKPRGPVSFRPGTSFACSLYFVLGLFLFIVALSPSEIYASSPDRWRSAILSVQDGAARLGLARPADRESPGGLATAVLDRVAPDDLGKLRRDAVRREKERVAAEFDEAAAAVTKLRALVEDRLGFSLDVSATTPQFDELVLEHDSVAEAWVALLNGADGYSAKVADARRRLDAVWVPDGVDVEAYDALFDEARQWDKEVDALVEHVDHLASMLKAKRFEDALDRDSGGVP